LADESSKEEILINVTPREVRAALLENGVLQDIYIERAARRSLERLPAADAEQLLLRLPALAHDPWPQGVVKLKGWDDIFRIRVGRYRILYRVDDLHVQVLDVGHRRDIYDQLKRRR